MSIQDVLREMRERRARAVERYCDPDNSCGATGGDVLKWADAIEAAMRDKDEELEFLRSVKESRGKELDEKDAEVERLQAKLSECDGKLGKRPCQNGRCMEYVRLREALQFAGKRCNDVHHPKSLQHAIYEPCPVEALIDAALAGTKGERV